MAISRRPWLIAAAVVAAAVVAFLAFGVFGVHTLFIDEEVSEAAPVFTSTSDDNTTGASDDGAEADNTENDTSEESESDAGDATTEPADDSGTIEPITVADGSFIDGAHPTAGTAVILSDGGDQRVLRLKDDFATDNGPDLNVYLASSADDFGDEYVDLGDLKGNIGAQNYEIPADVDLGLYDTVVIWCVRFGVGFGSAELNVA